MTQPDLERVRGNIAFLRSAAGYFRKRPTNGEDMAHWANTFDAQCCHAAADTIEALIKEREALKEALTPSGGTKAAYIGEVKERICVFDEDGEEVMADHTISWDATKAIMKMIAARAALNGEPQ